MESQSLSVTQLLNYLASIFARDPILQGVTVRGEISNLKTQASGHMYFTLKDEESRISCAMFRSDASRLQFSPKDGDSVVITGRVSVYEKFGTLQIVARAMAPAGLGELYEKLAMLSEELRVAGYFDEARKKPIPLYPKSIAVVTSPTGAVVHDIVSIVGRRAPHISIIVCPVAVQGEAAAGEIASMIAYVNDHLDCDAIILARGGGSLEELWAFNERPVAESIYQSRLPVISAIGHESDFTISDMAADLRAATPSAAAEIIALDSLSALLALADKKLGMQRSFARLLNQMEGNLEHYRSLHVFKDPQFYTEKKQMELDYAKESLAAPILAQASAYSLLLERVKSQRIYSDAHVYTKKQQDELDNAKNTLAKLMNADGANRQLALSSAAKLLESLSYDSVLKRGYALFYSEDGVVEADDLKEESEYSAYSNLNAFRIKVTNKTSRN
ncbi:MAG: exodeoxyribonuclease VII large subunit [Eubacteriaceae bacterium]|nr:exodeoxyribonuclease VII large subunit [Eubacteriaceae bacterium]